MEPNCLWKLARAMVAVLAIVAAPSNWTKADAAEGPIVLKGGAEARRILRSTRGRRSLRTPFPIVQVTATCCGCGSG